MDEHDRRLHLVAVLTAWPAATGPCLITLPQQLVRGQGGWMHALTTHGFLKLGCSTVSTRLSGQLSGIACPWR